MLNSVTQISSSLMTIKSALLLYAVYIAVKQLEKRERIVINPQSQI